MSTSVRPHELQPTRLLRPWDFSGESARVGCYCLRISLQPVRIHGQRKMARSNFQNLGRQVNGFNYVWQQMVGAEAKTSESKADLQF